MITCLIDDIADAKDNLMVAKIAQAHQANQHRQDDLEYKIGGQVMLSTLNHRREHKCKGEKHVAKFMQHFDGPFLVTNVHKEASMVSIDVPTQPNAFSTYHTSQIKPHTANDAEKYPSQTLAEPGPIMVDGIKEYTVNRIITHRKFGRGYQYRVQFAGWGPEHE